jgi:uncharacterized membrane protein
MLILILGLVVFFAIHSVRMVADGFREAQVAANERRWKGLYTLISLAGFALIVWGWIVFRGEAPEVYTPPDWGRHVNWAFTLIAFILFVASYLPTGYLKQRVKHPMLVGVALLTVGHLLANGDMASVLTFGAFLAYSVVNFFAVIPRGDPAPVVVAPRSDIIAVAAGAIAFFVFGMWLHPWLFGAAPFA